MKILIFICKWRHEWRFQSKMAFCFLSAPSGDVVSETTSLHRLNKEVKWSTFIFLIKRGLTQVCRHIVKRYINLYRDTSTPSFAKRYRDHKFTHCHRCKLFHISHYKPNPITYNIIFIGVLSWKTKQPKRNKQAKKATQNKTKTLTPKY